MCSESESEWLKRHSLTLEVFTPKHSLLQVRTMACILLRRMFTSNFEEMWQQLSPELQSAVKQELMVAIKEETVPTIRKKTCDVIAELARNMLGRVSVDG